MKKFIFILSILLVSSSLWAYDFTKSNFYYDIDTITKTAIIVDYEDSNLDIFGRLAIYQEFTYNGEIYTVTTIGDNAFSLCHNIKSVLIPNTITKIGKKAFYECSNLEQISHFYSFTSVGEGALDNTLWLSYQPDGCVYFGNHLYKYKGEMPANSSIIVTDGTLSICSFAFELCDNLINVTLPNSLKLIDKYAFSGCESLASITIPNSVDSIAIMAFIGCKSLINVELNSSLKLLKSNVFSYCTALSSIDLTYITNIEFGAFTGCSSLKSVVFGDSLSVIDKYAFMNCENLNRLIFPASLDSIGQSAFHGCSGIEYMEVQATTPPRINENTFDGVNREIEFIVPTEAQDAYASHKYWKVFMGGKDDTSYKNINDESKNVYYAQQNQTLYFNIDNPIAVIIYDVNGKKVVNRKLSESTKAISLDLNEGIYIVNIATDNQQSIRTKIMMK